MTFSTDSLAERAACVAAFHGTDLPSLSNRELTGIGVSLGALRRVVDALIAQVAGEGSVRDAKSSGMSSIARQNGFKSPQEQLAASIGVSHTEAGKFMAVGELLVAEPTEARPTANALREGCLGVDKAAVVNATLTALAADGVDELPLRALEERLVAKALTVSLWDLKKICGVERVRAMDGAVEARERRQREARGLTLTSEEDGMVGIKGLLDPASAAPIRAWLDAQVRSAFAARREDDADTRTVAQIRVDALATLAEHGMDCASPGSGVKTTVVIRVDKAHLDSGLGLATCDSLS